MEKNLLTSSPEDVAAEESDLAALPRRIIELSSEEFEGREACSDGGRRATEWIVKEMADAGLIGGMGEGSWFQAVPLTCVRTEYRHSSLSFFKGQNPITLPELTFRGVSTRSSDVVGDTDIVFVGFGISAPERDWDDYCGVDVFGKIVLILVSDPGPMANDRLHFDGPSMTYYGRWTYKVAEATRRGALGAIIVHSEKGTGYQFSKVRTAFEAPFLRLRDLITNELEFEGWCDEATARQLFAAAGLNYEDVVQRACRAPTAIPISGIRVQHKIATEIEQRECRNVVGLLPGTTLSNEYLVIMAHWDHLGIRVNDDGSRVTFNGAIDNASGVASLLSLVERLANDKDRQRSIIFAAVTGEECGLLGSEYFAKHCPVATSAIVAAFNLDGYLPVGMTRDITVIGENLSDLGELFRTEADKQGRYIIGDPNPSAGIFFRSDQINFALVGVPTVQVFAGIDLLGSGPSEGRRLFEEYTSDRYHTPNDVFDPAWDFSGMTKDITLLYRVARRLVSEARWPSWHQGVEFQVYRTAFCLPALPDRQR